MTNNPAYYVTELATALKTFTVYALGDDFKIIFGEKFAATSPKILDYANLG